MTTPTTGGAGTTGAAGTTGGAAGTGNPADAAPVQANPTDSSAVSDESGVQADTDTNVDHEGTGPGDDVDNLPPSNTTADVEDGVDGSDVA